MPLAPHFPGHKVMESPPEDSIARAAKVRRPGSSFFDGRCKQEVKTEVKKEVKEEVTLSNKLKITTILFF